MKNKGNFANSALPLYEVSELSKDEALLAFSNYAEDKTRSGILSNEILKRYYQDCKTDQQQH
jgi:hypothetical protein